MSCRAGIRANSIERGSDRQRHVSVCILLCLGVCRWLCVCVIRLRETACNVRCWLCGCVRLCGRLCESGLGFILLFADEQARQRLRAEVLAARDQKVRTGLVDKQTKHTESKALQCMHACLGSTHFHCCCILCFLFSHDRNNTCADAVRFVFDLTILAHQHVFRVPFGVISVSLSVAFASTWRFFWFLRADVVYGLLLSVCILCQCRWCFQCCCIAVPPVP